MKSKRDISKLLESIAADLESGKISCTDAAGTLRSVATCAKSPAPKRRGRPVGSRTKVSTPARDRTIEFFKLLDQGLTANLAKDKVAKKWTGSDPKTIYTDIRRHGPRIIEDGWADLYFRIGQSFIEQHGDIAENLIAPIREFYPRLAARVRDLGNATAADVILKMPPLEESREFVEFIGEWFYELSESICN